MPEAFHSILLVIKFGYRSKTIEPSTIVEAVAGGLIALQSKMHLASI